MPPIKYPGLNRSGKAEIPDDLKIQEYPLTQ